MWHCVQIGVNTVSWICWKSESPDGLPEMGCPLASRPAPFPAVQAASRTKHGASKIPFAAMKLVEGSGMPDLPASNTHLGMGNPWRNLGSARAEKTSAALG